MYIIVTTNKTLHEYIRKLNGNLFVSLQQINEDRYQEEAIATTTNRNLAMLALVDGAKVYESFTLSGLIPKCNSREELLDRIIDQFFEAIGIRKMNRGYDYVKYMIKRNVEDDDYCLNPMCKVVYPECASAFGVSVSKVIIHSNEIIRNSYKNNSAKYDVLYSDTHFSPLTASPKANNFIIIMADKIRKLMPEK